LARETDGSLIEEFRIGPEVSSHVAFWFQGWIPLS
jgi:hypothetical protein